MTPTMQRKDRAAAPELGGALPHVAIAAAVTAGWTFTYGFFENAGYPRLSMFTMWPVMGAGWGVLSIFQTLRQR